MFAITLGYPQGDDTSHTATSFVLNMSRFKKNHLCNVMLPDDKALAIRFTPSPSPQQHKWFYLYPTCFYGITRVSSFLSVWDTKHPERGISRALLQGQFQERGNQVTAWGGDESVLRTHWKIKRKGGITWLWYKGPKNTSHLSWGDKGPAVNCIYITPQEPWISQNPV